MDDTGPHSTVRPRRILMAGGHQHILGGLEIFIARARDCLGLDAPCYTDTPSAGLQSIRDYVAGLWRFAHQLPEYDIVWLHYGSAFDLAYLLVAKLSGKTVVVTPHLGRSWRTMRLGAVRAVCNRFLTAADAVFTLYRAQAAELSFPDHLARRCLVMPTFLPRALLEADAMRPAYAGPLRLIHIARLSAEKGSFAFLSVCAELRRRGVPLEASIVGPADDIVRQALQAEIASKTLPVTLAGALPQDALMELLRRHDVLVNLSLQDAYPLTILEALLCGVAPVCCALPGTEEMAAETAAILLVDGQNSQAAADQVLAVSRDTVRDGARLMRDKFDWARSKLRYNAAFASLARGASTSLAAEVTEATPR